MSDIEKRKGSDILRLIHGGKGEVLPIPFERDIFLFDTYVAGTSYIENMDEINEGIEIGDRLEFFREIDNPYDKKAIVVKTIHGEKIGYIPEKDNIVFSRLIDAGKLLFGRVSSKEKLGDWYKISMKIFLHD